MMRRKSLKKSSSADFLMKRSASLDVGVPAANNYPHLIEFPTSPQPVFGEEITHYTHSKHPLTELTLPDLFTCGGCKEYGSGKRFACQQCDFQLHHFCAHSPPLLKNHPLHAQHQLVFHSKPKPANAGISWPRCDICGKSSKGFTYRCRACSFQMHPCCAKLSCEINIPVHPHALILTPVTSAPSNAISTNSTSAITSSGENYYGMTNLGCGECKKRRSGRMYRCTVCEYHLHAVCAKSFINGLHANGIVAPEKPSMLGTAARLASQVVIEFIGGLIEGLGEGMGEALVQNVTRGRPSNTRRSIRETNN